MLPDLPLDRVDIIATGDPMLKLESLQDEGRRFFFDDHLETCRMLDRAGLRSFVFDQLWNRHDRLLPRIQGWDELRRLFGL